MAEIVRSYINEGIGLIQLAGLLVVGFTVLATWSKSRSVMATASAMLIGALVLGYLYNADWFGRKTAEDIQNRENGLEVLTGAALPVNVDQLEALGLLWARTAITLLWVLAAITALLLVRKVTGWRFDLGSPGRAARRLTIRARWDSVARSCGLTVSKDRRAHLALGAGPGVWALLDGTALNAKASTSTAPAPKPVERLPKLSKGRASPDRAMVTWTLTPARGQTVEDVADHSQALADALGVQRVAVRRTGPNRGELVAYLEDVFTLPRAWSPSVMTTAIPWGTDEHGAVASFPLGEGHALIAGSPGSGKSGLLNSLTASCAIRPDVALIGIDLKGGVELGPWAPRFTEVVIEPDRAAALIAEVADEVRRRYTLIRQLETRKMVASDQGIGPWVMVIIDELAELLTSIEMGQLISTGRLARACGVHLVLATQRPSAKVVSADLRDMLDTQRWCGRIPPNSTIGPMVLGDDCALDPSTITRAQRGVGVLDDIEGARLARPWWLDDAHVRAVAKQTAHLRIPAEIVFPNRGQAQEMAA